MKNWYLLLLVFVVLSCSKKSEPVKTSFYYWKTSFSLSDQEKATLDSLHVDRLYVRYFDVALKGNQPIPVMAVVFDQELPRQEIVPVIYIKNEVMLDAQVNLNDLADKIIDYVHQINTQHHINIKEIQLDCDWSLKSKDRFFSLIHFLKQKEKVAFSSTIRLHQVKYRQKTGVPDVDRGVLMYYNMGKIATDSLNSIYDPKIARKYIGSLANYPLHLDVALPLYSWIIQSRDGKIIRLISRVRRPALEQEKNLKKLSNIHYQVTESGTYFGQYFIKGDQIKLESISAKDLQEMVSDLKKNLAEPPKEIIFYDLDPTNIQTYEKQEIKKLALSF